MLRAIFNLLREHKAYRYILLGSLLSTIGSGLSQVAVYGELARLKASPLAFAIAFGLSLAPGLISSELGRRLVARMQPLILLSALELLGAMSVMIPWWGSRIDNPLLMQASQFAGAFLSGMMIPAWNLLASNYFKDEELPAVSGLGTYVFSANVLLGFGVGSLLFGQIPIQSYYLVDALSYLAGSALILLAYLKERRFAFALASEARQRSRFAWSKLSDEQKRAFLLMPALTLAGTPAVALIPSLAARYGERIALGAFLLNSVTVFLFAKTLGQLLGPLLIKPSAFDYLLGNRKAILGLIMAFGGLYWLASASPYASVALALIVLAHVLSNLVYVVAAYAIPKAFKGAEAANASAHQYQVQVTMMTIYACAGGWIAELTSVSFVIGANILLSVLLVGFLLRPNRGAICEPARL